MSAFFPGAKASLLLLLLAAAASSPARDRLDLTGAWHFAPDPMSLGEEYGWHQAGTNARDWFEVQVPHCWTVDARFPYTGTAWYRRNFSLPFGAAQRHARLIFKGVFYRAKVWVNGQVVGEHEGGYTPFEFDVTPIVRWQGENMIAVQVNNSWSTNTLPGARLGSRPQQQVYPWLEYGGIVQPVALVITEPVYVAQQRVLAVPDLSNGTAAIQVAASITNASGQPANVRLAFSIVRQGEKQAEMTAATSIPSRSAAPLTARVNLPAERVKLWDVDHPILYTLAGKLWQDGSENGAVLDEPEPVSFGIRKVEARSAALYLNGVPIRMGGGNRHADHPRYGSMDPVELVETDMRLMARANMQFSRISHYPASEPLLDWADRHGALIIEEGLNWQLTEAQMDAPEIRRKFQAQMREMIERDWNHPCVIGWSVGNEYPSDTPAGLSWTKDMVGFVRKLDDTRLLTFASNHAGLPRIANAQAESSCFVDLVCVNLYKDYAESLDRIHALWPDKSVMVSEFAARGHANLSEAEYEPYFRKMMAAFRARPYVVGASVWTFNDYRSRYPGTDADGYRHYGAVTADRQPKRAFGLLAGEFAPTVIRDGQVGQSGGAGDELTISATIQVREDFPSYPLRDYTIRCEAKAADGQAIGSQTVALPDLRPGAQHSLKTSIKLASTKPTLVRIEVLRPTGFVTVAQDLAVSP